MKVLPAEHPAVSHMDLYEGYWALMGGQPKPWRNSSWAEFLEAAPEGAAKGNTPAEELHLQVLKTVKELKRKGVLFIRKVRDAKDGRHAFRLRK